MTKIVALKVGFAIGALLLTFLEYPVCVLLTVRRGTGLIYIDLWNSYKYNCGSVDLVQPTAARW